MDNKKLNKFRNLGISLFFIDEDFKFKYIEGKFNEKITPNRKKEYNEWFNNYLKFYLFSSFDDDELAYFLYKNKLKQNDIKGFIRSVNNSTLEELYDYL